MGNVKSSSASLIIKKNFLNWRIIALQCCVGFYHTSKWISHRHTYVSSLLNLPPTHPSRLSPVLANSYSPWRSHIAAGTHLCCTHLCCPPPKWVVTEHQVELPVLHSSFSSASSFIYGIYTSATLSIRPLFPAPAASVSVLYTGVSMTALHIASPVPFF